MKILVAEDGRTSALALRLILEELGHEVTIAGTGIEAWERIQNEDWPIVITDWMMPGMEGIELCRKIRYRDGRPYSYVILLTSRDSHADRLAGLEAGADDFLTKPFDPEELNIRVKIAQRILAVQDELADKNRELAELATTDALTGLKNRRYFLESLHLTYSYAKRFNSPLSLLMIDVDHFKSYNDTYGHLAGDDALRHVGEVLRQSIREYETVSRYGGEEFAIVLQTTDAHAARIVGERIRTAILSHAWPLRPITVSIGLSTVHAGTIGTTRLTDEADTALYESKARGRNTVTHYEDLGNPSTMLDAPPKPCEPVGVSPLNGLHDDHDAPLCCEGGPSEYELVEINPEGEGVA